MQLKKQIVFSLDKQKIKKIFFDLNFVQNKKSGLIYHLPSKNLKSFIMSRYLMNSKNNVDMSKSNHRKKHGERFIYYLKNKLKLDIVNMDILEIGCGDSYILDRLKKKNNVYGVELKIKKKRYRVF